MDFVKRIKEAVLVDCITERTRKDVFEIVD